MEDLMQENTVAEPVHTVEFLPTAGRYASLRRTRFSYRVLVLIGAFLLGLSMGMGHSAEAQQATAQRVTQVVLPASLVTSLDSKKQKTGTEVIVKVGGTVTLKDGTSIPKGAKIVGHVTDAKARSGGDTESSMAIGFDTINLPDGKTLAIKGTLQALAPNPNEDDSGGGVDYGSSMNRSMEHAQAGTTMTAPVPILTEQSIGVFGIKNLQLGPDGVLKSNEKSVKVANRSQVVVRAQLAAN
jgi:hypothetical protein